MGIQKNTERKRKKVILTLKMLIFLIVGFFYYLFFKVAVFLVNYNLFSQHKEVFAIIDKIEENIIKHSEMVEKVEYTDSAVEKVKGKQEIQKYEEAEVRGIDKLDKMIDENLFLYGFFCNRLKKDYKNIYNKHYEDKCNDEHFMRMFVKKVMNN